MPLNLPNFLTFLRLCTAPFIAMLLVGDSSQRQLTQAVVLFVIAGALDKLDGVVARRWNQTTEFGAIFDPIVDKIWIHTINISLLSLNAIPLWVVAVLLARDFVVAELRGGAYGQVSTRAAHWLGKFKLRAQVIYSLCCMLNLTILSYPPFLHDALHVLTVTALGMSLFFSLASLVHYARLYGSRLTLIRHNP